MFHVILVKQLDCVFCLKSFVRQCLAVINNVQKFCDKSVNVVFCYLLYSKLFYIPMKLTRYSFVSLYFIIIYLLLGVINKCLIYANDSLCCFLYFVGRKL